MVTLMLIIIEIPKASLIFLKMNHAATTNAIMEQKTSILCSNCDEMNATAVKPIIPMMVLIELFILNLLLLDHIIAYTY